jgi:hypothetical protein
MGRSLRILAAGAVIPWLVAAALAGGPTKKTPQGPVTEITQKMTVVAGDLGKVQTGEPVQTKEKAIVGDLDELIAELEKQCAACRGGIKKNNPSRGMADSMISGGTGGIGDRDRILQSMSEGFPPEYRLVLERYYRRLAEEKAAPSGGDSPQAKPKAEASAAEKP